MNALTLTALSLLLLILGYRFYSPFITNLFDIDENQPTPAVERNDGVDYVPAKHWLILFGHHFSSIAGAAPIIGPVIACLYWGWLPALLWVVFGSMLFGGVHDLATLALSAKNGGQSIAHLTEDILDRTSQIIFSIFVFLTLILIVAVFAAVAGETLATTPAVVIPTFGLVFVAMLVGWLMYHQGFSIVISTVLGVVMLFGLIVLGYLYPLSLPVAEPAKWWTVILIGYGIIASVTPVSLLLQPRDHLAAIVLFLGMLFGFIGLVLTKPVINAPPVVSLSGDMGWLFPMLFITIGCGAISGFHSLVGSGTTSKQLPSMKDIRKIGYGGMVTESALSVLAIVAVTAGLYWKEVPNGLHGYVYQNIFKNGSWIKTFGVGYGEITSTVLGPFGTLIGITMLKSFVMTTLDSATRITRYIGTELLGETFGIPGMKNKYGITLLIGTLSCILALGNWRSIWPLFGSANQLVASVVFIVTSVWLFAKGKQWLVTAIPAILMLATTISALVYKTSQFLRAAEPNYLLSSIAIILIALALFILVQGVRIVFNKKSVEVGTSME